MQKRPKWNQKYRLSGRCHIGVQQGKKTEQVWVEPLQKTSFSFDLQYNQAK